MNVIRKELNNLFSIKSIEDNGSHYIDPSGKSTYQRSIFYFDKDDAVEIVCYDMSELLEEKGKSDRLAVTATRRTFKNFINKNYD